jgi:ankyrin repeat protein
MTEQQFHAIYPSVFDWVQQTLSQYAPAARLVNSLGFQRLPDLYDADLLANANVFAVIKVPVPPLSAMGLGRFEHGAVIPQKPPGFWTVFHEWALGAGDTNIAQVLLTHGADVNAKGSDGQTPCISQSIKDNCKRWSGY